VSAAKAAADAQAIIDKQRKDGEVLLEKMRKAAADALEKAKKKIQKFDTQQKTVISDSNQAAKAAQEAKQKLDTAKLEIQTNQKLVDTITNLIANSKAELADSSSKQKLLLEQYSTAQQQAQVAQVALDSAKKDLASANERLKPLETQYETLRADVAHKLKAYLESAAAADQAYQAWRNSVKSGNLTQENFGFLKITPSNSLNSDPADNSELNMASGLNSDQLKAAANTARAKADADKVDYQNAAVTLAQIQPQVADARIRVVRFKILVTNAEASYQNAVSNLNGVKENLDAFVKKDKSTRERLNAAENQLSDLRVKSLNLVNTVSGLEKTASQAARDAVGKKIAVQSSSAIQIANKKVLEALQQAQDQIQGAKEKVHNSTAGNFSKNSNSSGALFVGFTVFGVLVVVATVIILVARKRRVKFSAALVEELTPPSKKAPAKKTVTKKAAVSRSPRQK
jgi:chromosome segregation ATPase